MPAPSAPGRRPSWAQLGGGAFAVFAVVLAFLAGRVRAGTDPALARSSARAQPSAVQPSQQQQSTPDDPSQGQDFGDQSQGQSIPDDQSQSAPDPDPPVTHAS